MKKIMFFLLIIMSLFINVFVYAEDDDDAKPYVGFCGCSYGNGSPQRVGCDIITNAYVRENIGCLGDEGCYICDYICEYNDRQTGGGAIWSHYYTSDGSAIKFSSDNERKDKDGGC